MLAWPQLTAVNDEALLRQLGPCRFACGKDGCKRDGRGSLDVCRKEDEGSEAETNASK